MSFTLNEDRITSNRLRTGDWIARYIHPYQPVRFGVTNYVSEKGNTFHEARSKLINKLRDMGGIPSSKVVV